MHLEVIFKLLMCGPDAASPSRSGDTLPFVCNRQKLGRCFFFALMVAVVAFPLCMNVVEVMVFMMVPFLNKRQAQVDSLKWPIVPPPPLSTSAEVINIHTKEFFIHICRPPPLNPYPHLSILIIFFFYFYVLILLFFLDYGLIQAKYH